MDRSLQSDIKELSKHKEYVSLMRFIRTLHEQAKHEALNWSDVNDAHRKQGKYQSLNHLLEQLEAINFQTDLGVTNGNATPRFNSVGPDPDEYFDTKPSGPVY